MPDILLPVTVIFALLHVTSGLTSICLGVVACSLSDELQTHSVTPVWSGVCVSTFTLQTCMYIDPFSKTRPYPTQNITSSATAEIVRDADDAIQGHSRLSVTVPIDAA